jgi:hypothetical protein
MTINDSHRRVFVDQLGKQLQPLKAKLECIFVVVTDSRVHQNYFLRRPASRFIDPKWTDQDKIPTYVGVFVHTGTAQEVKLIPGTAVCTDPGKDTHPAPEGFPD